jgi:PEP-CTERM motif
MKFAAKVFRVFSVPQTSRSSRFIPPYEPSGWATLVTPWIFATTAILSVGHADAATISVTDVFQILEQASVNDTGASTSPVLFIGANTVVPNGFNGTTGTATSSDGSYSNYPLLNTASTAVGFQNQISTGIGAHAVPYNGSNPNLLNSWTLTFSNTAYSPAVVHTQSIAGFSLPAFANTVTITGGTTTPTISWQGSGDGAFVQILDKNECGNGASGSSAAECAGIGWPNVIYSPGDFPSSGSFQIPGGVLNATDSYVIVVAEVNTHDGSDNTVHHNEAAISRAYFDFTVNPDAPSVPINMPMIDTGGVFHFNVVGVGPETTTYIDPPVATGYIYQIGAGDPNFASVTLPILPDQTNPYEIEWDNGLDTAFVLGGHTFDFTGPGVSTFDVLGIDGANGLSPNDPTAFITALTFESSGNFTGTMTPIIPEPSTWAMMLIGFAGLGFAGYRASRRSDAIGA